MNYFNKSYLRTLSLLNSRANFSTSNNVPTPNPILMSYNRYDEQNAENRNPLIIMHGLFGSKNNWNSMSKALQKKIGRNIIAVDARNHGDSVHTNDFSYHHLVSDINHLFPHLEISSACIMGHSMGGRAMMLFALLYPEKVEKLLVIDMSPFQSSKSMYSMKRYFEALKSVNLAEDLTMPEARKLADQQLSAWIDDNGVRQFLLTNLVKTESGFNWKINLDVLSNKFETDIIQFELGTKLICSKPSIFIGGNKSDYLRPSDEGKIKNIFPAAKFIYLDSGHWVHAEKPYEFLNIVSEFINQS